MTKPETALREFCDRWSQEWNENTGWYKSQIMYDKMLPDLTALISENYYPKEFTNYCIKNVDYCRDMGKEWYQIMASGILILKTLDDVYNYWKENEQ